MKEARESRCLRAPQKARKLSDRHATNTLSQQADRSTPPRLAGRSQHRTLQMEPWLIGMQLAMLGCFCSAVGLVLLKHSTTVESELPFLQRKYFLLGFVFLIVNASVIDVFAFSLAPITLVAPFTGVTIVFTSWLASTGVLFVKESLDVWDATSTAITLAGVTITSIYGPHSSDAPDDISTKIGTYFSQPDFIVAIGILLAVLAIGWAVAGVEASALMRGARDPKATSGRTLAARILLYAYTAALCGSMSMLLLKVHRRARVARPASHRACARRLGARRRTPMGGGALGMLLRSSDAAQASFRPSFRPTVRPSFDPSFRPSFHPSQRTIPAPRLPPSRPRHRSSARDCACTWSMGRH